MTRYIDADKLKGEFCEACATHKRYHLSVEECRAEERPDRKWCFKMRLIDNAPTADVAPRAEVEELIYKLEYLLCHATGGRLSKHTYDLRTMETAVTDYLDESYCEGKEEGYKNAKAEVAREIFEALDKKIFHHIPDLYTFEIYTELKKKYTGESQ